MSAHFQHGPNIVAIESPPICYRPSPAELVKTSRADATFLVLGPGRGRAEANKLTIGIDLMAAKKFELVDRGPCNAPAEVARRPCRRGVASGLHRFPEYLSGDRVRLRQRRMRGEGNRHSHGADKATHIPSLRISGSAARTGFRRGSTVCSTRGLFSAATPNLHFARKPRRNYRQA